MLAAAGDFDTESLVALLEQSLGSWSANGRSSLPPVPNVETTAKPGVYLIDRPIPQSSISIGHFGVDRTNPDRQAIELMNQLLRGGGFTSRIPKRGRSAAGWGDFVGRRVGGGRR